jgi:hypothetical protein
MWWVDVAFEEGHHLHSIWDSRHLAEQDADYWRNRGHKVIVRFREGVV